MAQAYFDRLTPLDRFAPLTFCIPKVTSTEAIHLTSEVI